MEFVCRSNGYSEWSKNWQDRLESLQFESDSNDPRSECDVRNSKNCLARREFEFKENVWLSSEFASSSLNSGLQKNTETALPSDSIAGSGSVALAEKTKI